MGQNMRLDREQNCIWLDPEEELQTEKYNIYDRVYIGDEGCSRFLSSPDFLRRINELVSSGTKVGIIASYLTPEREANFIRLLETLPEPMEIIVNDVGALRLVSNSRHTPAIGRLLVRQNTDPAIYSFYKEQPERVVRSGQDRARLTYVAPSVALTRHLVGSTVFSSEAASIFLAEFSCANEKMTVMMDLLPQGMPDKIPDGFRVLLNTGNILVSVLPCHSCESCSNQEVSIGKTRANVPIYRKRNICYYKYSDLPR